MDEKVYQTITGRQINIGDLEREEQALLREARAFLAREQDWTKFAAWWLKRLLDLGLPKTCLAFRVCSDIEERLGISQGRVAPPDYRAFLIDRIEERFGSRNQFCEESGIDKGQLSRVLAGKADFSMSQLQRLLDLLDLELAVHPRTALGHRHWLEEGLEGLEAA